MKRQPVVRQLQPLAPTSRRGSAAGATWGRFAAALADPEFLTVAIFSAIGFLIALNAIIYVPDFSASMQQIGQFP